MTAADPIVIASYARTPMGAFQGALSGATRAATGRRRGQGRGRARRHLRRAGGEDLHGLRAAGGLGQAPARQAALGANLPLSAEATTVNKVCGSGMQAAILAHDMLAAGSADVIVAGGMESMTNAPYLMMKHRGGARMGHDKVMDSMFLDGLEDAYEPGQADGRVRRRSGHRVPAHAPGAGRIRHPVAGARPEGPGLGRLQPRDRCRRGAAGQGQGHRFGRRRPGARRPGQDPEAQTRLLAHRHGDGGEFVVDLATAPPRSS